jgi:hypothetical protein
VKIRFSSSGRPSNASRSWIVCLLICLRLAFFNSRGKRAFAHFRAAVLFPGCFNAEPHCVSKRFFRVGAALRGQKGSPCKVNLFGNAPIHLQYLRRSMQRRLPIGGPAAGRADLLVRLNRALPVDRSRIVSRVIRRESSTAVFSRDAANQRNWNERLPVDSRAASQRQIRLRKHVLSPGTAARHHG